MLTALGVARKLDSGEFNTLMSKNGLLCLPVLVVRAQVSRAVAGEMRHLSQIALHSIQIEQQRARRGGGVGHLQRPSMGSTIRRLTPLSLTLPRGQQ